MHPPAITWDMPEKTTKQNETTTERRAAPWYLYL